MKLTRTVHFNPTLFQVVPMVNVLFLVFMLFAMSSRFVLQPGFAISLPLSSFALGPQLEHQIVSVTSAPVPNIYYRDQKVTLAEFADRLGAKPAGPHSLIIRADKNTPYDVVVQLTNVALQHGYSVALATAPKPL